jgi:non-ribosomal peptide synthetase component F
MEKPVVHRTIEQHAAARGETVAIRCGNRATTYRDLNNRANAVARQLLDARFRRGGHVVVNLPPGAELAALLLGVLKSGGAYTWLADEQREPYHAAMAPQISPDPGDYHVVDLDAVLREDVRPGPNLPILTRPTDIACVLLDDGDRRPLLVPHSTITALPPPVTAPFWDGDRTTFDLWTGLMAGTTVFIDKAPPLRIAA